MIIASVPILKPFMGLAESGMLNVALSGPGTAYNTYDMKTFSSKNNSGKDATIGSWKSSRPNHKTVITGHSRRQGDGNSIESNGSDKIFIRQTTEWTVHEDQPDSGIGSARSSV